MPDHGGFALIGDPHSGQVVRPQTASFHRLLNHILRAAPDLFRVVLYPAWLGIDLFVFFLS
jgi:hypothetical protein